MKAKYFERTGMAVGIVSVVWLALLSIKAQDNGNKPKNFGGTTNWLGFLVVGKPNTIDPIAPGAFPQCEAQVQIGLRNDGVVVWRFAPIQSAR